MNIIVAGCGKVGQAIAKQLCSDEHEVTVMDVKSEAIQRVTSSFDVIGYRGDCTSIRAQIDAGVKKTDLLIAVTDSDEKNMLACLIARKAGKCQTIARVRSPQYSEEIDYLKEELGLSMSINPERVAADEMARLIQIPSALEVDTFAKGRVSLVSLDIPEGSVLDGTAMKDLPQKINMNTLVCVVEHAGKVSIPDGNTVLHTGDRISVTISLADIGIFLNRVGIRARKMKNVLIAGGGRMSYYLAKKLLSLHMNVKIIEQDKDRCESLADMLDGAMVIHGDATDQHLLSEEDLEEMDVVAALMGKDEENILFSMYVNRNTRAKTMTSLHRNSFEGLTAGLPLGNIISTKKITAEYITRYVRSMQNTMESDVETLYRMMEDQAEALEFKVAEESEITQIPLKDLKFKPNTLLCCINRKKKIIRPSGRDMIEVGDTIVVVTTNKGFNSIYDIVV